MSYDHLKPQEDIRTFLMRREWLRRGERSIVDAETWAALVERRPIPTRVRRHLSIFMEAWLWAKQ